MADLVHLITASDPGTVVIVVFSVWMYVKVWRDHYRQDQIRDALEEKQRWMDQAMQANDVLMQQRPGVEVRTRQQVQADHTDALIELMRGQQDLTARAIAKIPGPTDYERMIAANWARLLDRGSDAPEYNYDDAPPATGYPTVDTFEDAAQWAGTDATPTPTRGTAVPDSDEYIWGPDA